MSQAVVETRLGPGSVWHPPAAGLRGREQHTRGGVKAGLDARPLTSVGRCTCGYQRQMRDERWLLDPPWRVVGGKTTDKSYHMQAIKLQKNS